MIEPVNITSMHVAEQDRQTLAKGDSDSRIEVLKQLFYQTYGEHAEFLARAGGRINLIGEHVDYPQAQFSEETPAHLFSMGGAVGEEYLTMIRYTDDGLIQLAQADDDQKFEIAISDLREYEEVSRKEREARKEMKDRVLPPWAFHTLGGFAEAINRGVDISGAEVILTSSVPFGAGMSNSAANLVSLGLILFAKFPSLNLGDKTALASFARDSENGVFSGGHCGFLDQLLICHSKKGALTKIDYADKAIEHFNSALPESMQFLAFNTNVPHVLAESEYPDRVKELELAHEYLSKNLACPVTSCDLSLESLNKLISILSTDVKDLTLPVEDTTIFQQGRALTDEEIESLRVAASSWEVPDLMRHKGLDSLASVTVLMRRVRHQKASSLIVPLAGQAAMQGDTSLFGTLLTAEGVSLRMSGDFQITGENGAQDYLLDAGFQAASKIDIKVYGRMLGGGGGGNVLFFVDRSNEDSYAEWKTLTATLYEKWANKHFGKTIEATVIEPVIAPGASLLIP